MRELDRRLASLKADATLWEPIRQMLADSFLLFVDALAQARKEEREACAAYLEAEADKHAEAVRLMLASKSADHWAEEVDLHEMTALGLRDHAAAIRKGGR